MRLIQSPCEWNVVFRVDGLPGWSGEVVCSQSTTPLHWYKAHGLPDRAIGASHDHPKLSPDMRNASKPWFGLCARDCFVVNSGRITSRFASPVPSAPIHPASQVANAIDEIDAIFTQQQQQPAVIQAGDIDEASPWLDRTGWAGIWPARRPSSCGCASRPPPRIPRAPRPPPA